MTMRRFTIDTLPWDCLILRVLSSDDRPESCARCGEPAVQQPAVRGIAITYYFCLQHAVAREA